MSNTFSNLTKVALVRLLSLNSRGERHDISDTFCALTKGALRHLLSINAEGTLHKSSAWGEDEQVQVSRPGLTGVQENGGDLIVVLASDRGAIIERSRAPQSQ